MLSKLRVPLPSMTLLIVLLTTYRKVLSKEHRFDMDGMKLVKTKSDSRTPMSRITNSSQK